MPKKVHAELWVDGLRDSIRGSCGRGWTVQEKNGQIRLNVRTEALQGSLVLPFPWERGASGDVQARIRNIYALCQRGHGLRDAATISENAAPRGQIQWEATIAAFREKKITTGMMITEKTWNEDYSAYLEFIVSAMKASKGLSNAITIAQALINEWKGRPRSAEKALIALKAYLDYAITYHGLPSKSWTLSRDQIKEIRGRPQTRPELAILEDSEILLLVEEVNQTKNGNRWKNYAMLASTYGLRREEPWSCYARKNPRHGLQMWCQYQKISGAYKTQPRWLLPLPPTGSGWGDLVREMHKERLPLPGTLPGAWNTLLSKLEYWRELVNKYENQNQYLKPGAIRDAYSYRAHQSGMPLHKICMAMGHSLITHQKHYVWAREDSIFD